jgi:hypothetical protein
MAARLAKDKVKLDEFVHVEFGQPGENEAAGKKQRIKVLAGVKKVVALQAEVGKMRKMSIRSSASRPHDPPKNWRCAKKLAENWSVSACR